MSRLSAIALLAHPEAIRESTCFSLPVKRDTGGSNDELDGERFSIKIFFNVFLGYHKSPFKTAQIPLLINGKGSLL